mmetsp:Transcript_37456/g.93997  ORF Transcript_37456/g.93997 Transcript_37456/m.93997 type:complete len:271 (+) Transcript_37456:204-1016(+)
MLHRVTDAVCVTRILLTCSREDSDQIGSSGSADGADREVVPVVLSAGLTQAAVSARYKRHDWRELCADDALGNIRLVRQRTFSVWLQHCGTLPLEYLDNGGRLGPPTLAALHASRCHTTQHHPRLSLLLSPNLSEVLPQALRRLTTRILQVTHKVTPPRCRRSIQACEQLQRHHTGCVDISKFAVAPCAVHLGCHVDCGADYDLCFDGHCGGCPLGHRRGPCQAEVADACSAKLVEQDVGRLDVPVNLPRPVQIRKPAHHIVKDAHAGLA